MGIKKINPGDPESASANVVEENVKLLKRLFPELVTEGEEGWSVNVDVLKQLVGDRLLTDADEKYGLNWFGKRRARQLALTPSTGTLRPAPEESEDWDTTQNLFIEGDNLEVLKLLQKSYAGKVKLIYIDPPYNTGRDFVYQDDYNDSIKNYRKLTGQIDDRGLPIMSNTEASGRFHTHWLNMIYPRIKLAHTLLRDDGAIFISIGDEEVYNLRQICNEIFGEENYRNTIIVRRRVKSLNSQYASSGLRTLNIGYEHILIYAKSAAFYMNPLYKKKKNAPRKGKWDVFWSNADRPTMRYELLGFRPSSGQWRYSKERAYAAVENYKKYIEKYSSYMSLEEYWEKTGRKLEFIRRISGGTGKNGGVQHWIPPSDTLLRTTDWTDMESSEVHKEFDIPFTNPKNKKLILEILKLILWDSGDIVIDFFAGSGTTGHAVMLQNAIDGEKRRYILIQLPEPLSTNKKEQSDAAEYCDRLGKPRNIAELAKERLRRAAVKVKEEHPEWNGDTGFRVFKLDSSNIKSWNPQPEDLERQLEDMINPLLPDRTPEDVLYELLLKLGLDLCVPIEARELVGKTIYSVGGGVLMTCLDKDITTNDVERLGQGIVSWRKELAPAAETTVVFLDSAFENDVAKANLVAILEQGGITNIRSL